MQISLPLSRLLNAYERYGRGLPPSVNVLLVIALAFAVARLTWSLVPVPEAARWQPPPAPPPAPVAQRPGGNGVDAIVGAHLFGQYVAPEQAKVIPGNAPDTRLPLTLMGILAGRNDESLALISSTPGDEKPYAIGDDVSPGVTIKEIYPDRVILARGSAFETLRLDKDQPSNSPAYLSPTATPDEDESGDAEPASTQLGQIRSMVMTDPSKAAEFIRVQPANAGGSLHGYRIYPGRDRTLFNEAGLRPGDLVTAVNGIQLDDTQKALQMLNDLSHASDVTLTLERGGQVQTVTVSLN
jgi:general secretion pathway protein C